ncbi:MAG: secretin N-terminal domain-containing protein [Verrucomicrobiota bacterium JB022]|nr:secretin N-terminal domain-containing protein [Verrucomicrobiota bacterium JB022]
MRIPASASSVTRPTAWQRASTLSLLLLGSTLAWAQPTTPPRGTPPPPPTTPPPFGPPPSAPSSLPSSLRTPGSGTTVVNRSATGDESQAPASVADTMAPDRMQDPVGVIRISQMGTQDVLQMLENYTSKPILRQQGLPEVKVSFYSQGQMNRGEAIRAIESLLALNGIAILPLGDEFLKAVHTGIAVNQTPPLWEGSTLNAKSSQQIYQKLFHLSYLTTDEAVPAIQPLMSQGAPLVYHKSSAVLVTDPLVNLQRIERLLTIIDSPAQPNIKMLFIPLNNISSRDALQRMQQLQAGPLRRQLEFNTSFDADERTNQVIAFTHPGNEQLIRQLVEQLDVDVAPMTRTKVYPIRYATAEDVVSLIEQVVTGQKDARDNRSGEQPTVAQQRAAAERARSNQAAAALRADASNLQFSDFMTIVSDERANRVVASGTENDLRYLEQLISEIDVLLAQVRIEVVITDVTLGDNDVSGLGAFGISYNNNFGSSAKSTDTSTTTDSDGNTTTTGTGKPTTSDGWILDPFSAPWGVGFNAPLYFGPDSSFGLDIVFQTVQTNRNASVLSAPTIVTTHNREASISVGEQRPVLTSSTTNLNTNNNAITNQIQFKDINLELNVTPLIGDDGVIQLEIEQTVDNVIGEVNIGEQNQPIIGTRRANSFVSVENGGMVVLGGLQRNDTAETESSNPILGKIPLLNKLFNRTTKSNTRTELLIFIRPTILRTPGEISEDAGVMLDRMEKGAQVRDYLETGTFRPRGEPPLNDEGLRLNEDGDDQVPVTDEPLEDTSRNSVPRRYNR